MGVRWQIEESKALTHGEAREETIRDRNFSPGVDPPVNAVLRDVRIHDTKKWFNLGALVRLDALVLTPAASTDQVYQASTFEFPGVKDGDTLAIEPDAGLGFFTGWPAYFVDICVVATQGKPDQPTLAQLMANSAESLGELLGKVTPLLAGAPPAAAITGAAAAAASLSASIMTLIEREITGKSIGLYRATWYEHRDRFGIGRHPAEGSFRAQELGFSYEFFQDLPR